MISMGTKLVSLYEQLSLQYNTISNASKGLIVTKKWINAVMVMLVQIVIYHVVTKLDATTGFVKMSKIMTVKHRLPVRDRMINFRVDYPYEIYCDCGTSGYTGEECDIECLNGHYDSTILGYRIQNLGRKFHFLL